jgi:ADP-ribosylation factor related protein 1
MFSLISGFLEWATSKEELKIAVIGLSNAGKSSIMERVKGLFNVNYKPAKITDLHKTIGMNLIHTQIDGISVSFWDLGGTVQSIWPQYYPNADGLIFVIDASDPSSFAKAHETLMNALLNSTLRDIPFLVLANKCDVVGASSESEITEVIIRGTPLSLSKKNHAFTYKLFRVSALNDTAASIYDAVTWLTREAQLQAKANNKVQGNNPR